MSKSYISASSNASKKRRSQTLMGRVFEICLQAGQIIEFQDCGVRVVRAHQGLVRPAVQDAGANACTSDRRDRLYRRLERRRELHSSRVGEVRPGTEQHDVSDHPRRRRSRGGPPAGLYGRGGPFRPDPPGGPSRGGPPKGLRSLGGPSPRRPRERFPVTRRPVPRRSPERLSVARWTFPWRSRKRLPIACRSVPRRPCEGFPVAWRPIPWRSPERLSVPRWSVPRWSREWLPIAWRSIPRPVAVLRRASGRVAAHPVEVLRRAFGPAAARPVGGLRMAFDRAAVRPMALRRRVCGRAAPPAVVPQTASDRVVVHPWGPAKVSVARWPVAWGSSEGLSVARRSGPWRSGERFAIAAGPSRGGPAKGFRSRGGPSRGGPAKGFRSRGGPVHGAPANGLRSRAGPSRGGPAKGFRSRGAPSAWRSPEGLSLGERPLWPIGRSAGSVGGPLVFARSLASFETLLPPVLIPVFLRVLELLARVLMFAAWTPVASPSLHGTPGTGPSRLGVPLCLVR